MTPLSCQYLNQSLYEGLRICDSAGMLKRATAISLLLLLPAAAIADQHQRVYRWVDEEGRIHYGDSVPAEAADLDKQVINDAGITLDVMRGKKTPEEIAEELRLQQIAEEREAQRRADAALLATYLSVEEIVMHRDRRVELFQAQARVTELYLRNLRRRLDSLQEEAARYRPYNSDPDAEVVPADLARDLRETKSTIERHEGNLARFRQDEAVIIARFATDIDRFKELKGMN